MAEVEVLRGPLRDATLHDILVLPARRDASYLLSGLVFWFALQHGTAWLLRSYSAAFRRMKKCDQDEVPVRLCAVANGACSLYAAYLYVFVAQERGWDIYAEIEDYHLPLAWLVSYFTWDFCVCLYYNWGVAYTLHAFVSGFGMYLGMYPHSHLYTGYYSGVFEISNIFVHGAFVLRKFDAMPGLCKVFDVIFALMFFIVRVFGGTYVSYSWCCVMGAAAWRGEVHSTWVAWYSLTTIWIVQGLSYYWSGAIIQGVREAISPTQAIAPSPTTRAKGQKRSFGTS